jgi:hypothetical protein
VSGGDLHAQVSAWVGDELELAQAEEAAGGKPPGQLGYWVMLADHGRPRIAIMVTSGLPRARGRPGWCRVHASWPPEEHDVRKSVRVALDVLAR